MPRFVILEHDHPHLHWDFLLEDGDALLTWRLAGFPRPGEQVAAQPIARHRLAYLEYEGPVSGGRGRVIRREQGSFSWLLRTSERQVVRLAGEALRGLATLTADTAGAWSFLLHPETECPP